ncbi:MAG: UDP-N-acetylglucosamine 1-carboxyvinyltransferase [Rhodospirillaceae bacterium]|nr:UDP-N-acetylglucosamine 1-carboxyvinyltransferase [Rhodospirillaceae bacterium]
MDRIRIVGGRPLKGTIPVSGAKNAALPLMAACLLTDKPLTLTNLPQLADIKTLTQLLEQHGVKVSVADHSVTMEAKEIPNTVAPYDIVRRMRASVLVLGPLLARFGNAVVSMPGGCAIGSRPIDLHLSALEQMGAKIHIGRGYIHADAPKGLKGAKIKFDKVSVGATENILMAAALAKGETVIENAAREPEVTDLAKCLMAMGAQIEGLGTDKLVVKGSTSLDGATHKIVGDRIEAGTYAIAAAITHGDITLEGAEPEHLASLSEVLRKTGSEIEETEAGVRVKANGGKIAGADVMTEPFPGFPTDLQAQFMALMATAQGVSRITETVFENRFMHVPELSRMGADIVVDGEVALVTGVPRLKGAPVMATDLRASVSLVLAGLAAEGETIVNRVYHLDRGFERLEEKLSGVGARIERIH